MIAFSELNEPKWYVIHTSSRAEQKVSERLLSEKIEVFLPTYKSMRIWSDRKKLVTAPLISSTLFVKCSAQDLPQIYPIKGVAGILRYLGKPAVVQDWEIENLRILIKEMNGQHIEAVAEPLEPGEEIKVVRGPFKGLFGTSVECKGKHRILITLDSIGAAFTVSVPRSYVKKIQEQLIA